MYGGISPTNSGYCKDHGRHHWISIRISYLKLYDTLLCIHDRKLDKDMGVCIHAYNDRVVSALYSCLYR